MGHIYTPLKVFHYPDKLNSLPLNTEMILPPLHIRLKPTNICNHNCWYCAYRQDNFQLGKDMSTRDLIPREKMMETVDDIIELGVKSVTFSGGGEPFLYPYLYETALKLTDYRIKIASLTNGSRLTGDLAELFAERAIWVRVSMDGWDSVSYAAYRKVSQGEYLKVINNMEAFQKLGGQCYLSVVINIDKENAIHVYDMIKNLNEIGVNSVKVAPAIISNHGDENNNYHRPFFTTVRDQIQKAIMDFANPQFEIFDSYHEQLNAFYKDYTWCPMLQMLTVIGADQNVYSCQDKAYNLDEGLLFSIKDRRFKEGWMEAKNTFFKINPNIVCNHHCVAHRKNLLIHEYFDIDAEHLTFV